MYKKLNKKDLVIRISKKNRIFGFFRGPHQKYLKLHVICKYNGIC